jgi:hypothetical protein
MLFCQLGHATAESPRVPLGLVFCYRSLKLNAGEELQSLRKNAAYSIQGGAP